MNCSRLITRLALAAAGAGLLLTGATSTAQAFSLGNAGIFTESSVNEPNNGFGNATNLGSAVYSEPGKLNILDGILGKGDPADVFTFFLPTPGAIAGGFLSINTTKNNNITPLVRLYDANKTLLGSSTALALGTSSLQLSNLSSGNYFLKVIRSGGNPNNIVSYSIDARFREAAAVPTPALLPGLIGLGVAGLRKRRGETATVVEEA